MSGALRVLVAEDEPTFGRALARFLQEHGHEVKLCATADAARKALAASDWHVLLLDLKLPDADGVAVLSELRESHPDLQTIIVTGFANVDSAIASMRLGAFDYLTKPPNFEELALRVERAGHKAVLERENRRLRFQVQRGQSGEILTRSPAMQKVLRTLDKVAAASTPVLIQGESGVGKELLAQHLHRSSPRRHAGFVDLNCAAVPATLLESELFGYERGAFTGASAEKPGLVEVADGGTLFLDEVAEMAPELQSKLLRVLDSGTFYRLGATRKRRSDFRLVAATNVDLGAAVTAGRFRHDLFYRIQGVRVFVPPLRERPEDVALLVEHYARGLGRRFSSAAVAALERYHWPGNVRELRFAVERAALLAEGPVIEPPDLPPEVLGQPAGPAPSAGAPSRPHAPPRATRAADAGPDRHAVREALERARWNRRKAAEILGVSPRTLFRWLQRLEPGAGRRS
jgi:two-component system response regulator AtoC